MEAAEKDLSNERRTEGELLFCFGLDKEEGEEKPEKSQNTLTK
jgi:hypothetical protein